MQLFKKIVNGSSRRMKSLSSLFTFATILSFAASAYAAPATGNTDIDQILTAMETGFGTGNRAFTYLAIGAIPLTVIVVVFFWLRGKFKQAVSGA